MLCEAFVSFGHVSQAEIKISCAREIYYDLFCEKNRKQHEICEGFLPQGIFVRPLFFLVENQC